MISPALCGQLVLVFHSSCGPSLGGAELASRPSPFALLQSAFGGAAHAPGQPPAAPRLSRSSPLPGAAGGAVLQPRAFPGVCLKLALEVSLGSRFRGGRGGDWRALRKPSGQDKKGGRAAAGVRCVPSRLRRSAQRSQANLTSSIQIALAGGSSARKANRTSRPSDGCQR
nr:unnamed protein product [Rangifer tarandus platyrhynchus]